LHEFTSNIPLKTPKRKRSRSTNKMLHTDITVRAQRTRVSGPHAREATNSHQNSQAIDQLSRLFSLSHFVSTPDHKYCYTKIAV
jgi:hypothetical protein